MKKFLKRWLGIENVEKDIVALKCQSTMAIDFRSHEPTVIVLATTLGGGRVNIIPCHSGITLEELTRLRRQLEETYGRQAHRYIDWPMGKEKAAIDAKNRFSKLS